MDGGRVYQIWIKVFFFFTNQEAQKIENRKFEWFFNGILDLFFGKLFKKKNLKKTYPFLEHVKVINDNSDEQIQSEE